MKPPAETHMSKPPSRDQIAQRLAAGKAKPKENRSSQQDIQAKVTPSIAGVCFFGASLYSCFVPGLVANPCCVT